MKKTILATLLIALVLAAMALSCDTGGGGKPEPVVDEVKPQGGTGTEITNLFGKGINVTVKGDFTDAEWGSGSTGVVGRIRAALQDRYDASTDTIKDVLLVPIFSQTGGVTIIVERDPLYANYSATYEGNVIHINFAILNDPAALNLALYQGTRVLMGTKTVPEQG